MTRGFDGSKTICAVAVSAWIAARAAILFFSHAPEDASERFQSENAFYFSFYRQLVAGEQISRLIADPLSEAPATVPALRRFNIYQELCFGLLYRGLQFFPGTLMSPATFYCLCVFVVYGFGLLAFFSMLGSAAEVVLAGALYVSGLEECTHVAFMPPLRENCAMTFWFVSLWALQDLHKKQAKADFALTAGLRFLLSVTMFVLLWQFACFALLLQAFALYAMLLLGLLEASFVAWASRLHACGTLLASLLRLGDTWPLRSPFFSLAVAFSMCKGRCSAVLCGGLALLLHRLVACEDDAHIQDFLRYRLQAILHTVGDKPPPVASYHAALYAGQRSFSSPQLAELRRPLLYAGGASCSTPSSCRSQSLLALATAPLYLLMMRYQMLFFPQMVLLGGSCATFLPPWLRLPLAMGVFALSEGSVPWRGQASAFLEDKVERDVLMSWIRNYTAPEDVIISGMGVSALVRLHALRGIVCHPHYESAQLRERCFWADKLHGHRTLEEYHAIIRQRLLPGFNGRAFVAVSVKDCFSVNEAGQVVSGLVEVDEPWRRTRPKTCDLLYQLAAKKGLGFQPRWLGRWFALLEFLPGGVGQPLQFSQATRCAFGRYLYEEKGDAMAAEHFQKIGQSWRKLAPACGCAAELFGPAQDIHIAHSWAVEEERRGFGCCPMSPKFSTCLSDKAFRLLRQGQSPALAELYFQKAAELAPSSPKAHGFLGFARLQAGMALEAQQSFQRALQLEETPTDTTKCGEALSRVSLGQLAGARLALKELPSCRQHLQG
ncbi:unnamed protein product, partial [Effrenium voratum]